MEQPDSKPTPISDDFKKLRLGRVAWHCRRGMLELDLWLLPFYHQHFGQLDDAGQKMFETLISYEDQDIYAWLMGHCQAPSEVKEMVIFMQQAHARQP